MGEHDFGDDERLYEEDGTVANPTEFDRLKAFDRAMALTEETFDADAFTFVSGQGVETHDWQTFHDTRADDERAREAGQGVETHERDEAVRERCGDPYSGIGCSVPGCTHDNEADWMLAAGWRSPAEVARLVADAEQRGRGGLVAEIGGLHHAVNVGRDGLNDWVCMECTRWERDDFGQLAMAPQSWPCSTARLARGGDA